MVPMKKKPQKLAGYIGSRINLKNLDSSRPVLQFIAEHEQVSLSQISQALNLSRGTCNLHLQRLEHDQFIRRYDSKRGRTGRPTVIWGWDEPANLTVSLLFDVPFLHASLSDFGNHAVLREIRDLSDIQSGEELHDMALDFATRARAMADQRGSRIRQGMVYLPGLIHPATGVVRHAVNFPLLEGIDFRRILMETTGATCQSAPMGSAFYFGESESLPAHANLMVVYWDLGVGVVFGHGDRLCSLGINRADGEPTMPELGHIRIKKDGRRCQCGRSGCLEAYTGGWALMEMMQRTAAPRLADFIRLVQRGDREAVRWAGTAAQLLGRHLTGPLQVMQTDHIRICGPMAPVFECVSDRFETGLSSIFSAEEINQLDVSVSPIREERFLHGAHRLARRMFTHPEVYGPILRTQDLLHVRVEG